MIHRRILLFIIFLTFPTTAYSLVKKNIYTNQIKKINKMEEKRVSKVFEAKKIKTSDEKSNISKKSFQQNYIDKMEIDNDEKVKSIESLKNDFYLNFSMGYSSLKDYDVINTSTNNAIWNDRYTELGSSIEVGIGYDFGKIRTEISYSQESGRFDEYFTYFDKSITKVDVERGKLQKDFYIINTYYDFRDVKRFSPYVGLGLGFVNSVQDSAPFIPSYVRQAFVLQLKAGFSYKISDQNILYIEGFKRNANSHTTNDGIGTAYIYEVKDGFDSSGVNVGFRKML